MAVKQLDHALERMLTHALELLRDVEAIESIERIGRPGGYLLQLTAVEILLKAGALKADPSQIPTGHNFGFLYDRLAPEIRRRIESEFRERELHLHGSTAAPFKKQIETLGKNFVQFRYVYEAWFPYTHDERLERETRFLRSDLPVEDWDVVYYISLLDIMLRELLGDLEPWRLARLPRVRWEPDGHRADGGHVR